MSFARAKRFNQELIGCGPPPTAYNPKPQGGSNALSFPKGERFRDQSSNELDVTSSQLTRSHSSSSVGSTESGISQRSNTVKKDHTHCNKQIADLEKELRVITLERNGLFKQKLTSEGTSNEILKLNTMIEELHVKLEAANAIKEEKLKLENERDKTLVDLEDKQKEILHIMTQIDEMKVEFQKEEEMLQKKLDGVLTAASIEKKELEVQISGLQLEVKTLTNVEAELAQELAGRLTQHEKEVADQEIKHEKLLETMKEEHVEKIRVLENNIQQLVAEHDAESEQIKFEYSRQVDELNQTHDAAVVQLTNEHNQTLVDTRVSHEEELNRMKAVQNDMEIERKNLLKKNEEMLLSLETKEDAIATLTAQIEVANEKMESDRLQAEERCTQLKKAFDSDIQRCKESAEEAARVNEEALRSTYEEEKSKIVMEKNELEMGLQEKHVKLEQLEQTMEITYQAYEDKLQRLNENTQTEKEILIWQMNQQKENLEQEFKANYDSRLSEAEMEFENRCAEWETKMNRAKEDFNEEISTMISNHSLQLSNYRELHEAALDSLEREKVEMMEEREAVEKKLSMKEDEIERLSVQMKEQATQLELDMDLLRESNNDLVGDLLRITQDKLMADERNETDKVELHVQVEKEKEELVQSYEKSINSLNEIIENKSQMLKDLAEQMDEAHEDFRTKLYEKEVDFNELKESHHDEMVEVADAHQEEIKELHKSYERVIMDIENKFATEKEDIERQFEAQRTAIKNRSQTEMKILQDEFCVAFEDVDKKLKAEKREIQKLKEAIQLRDKQTADEWIQRETNLMDQFSSQALKDRQEFDERVRIAEEERKELLDKVETLTAERDAAIEDTAVLQVQTEAQLAALNEQCEEERTMLLGKLSEQTEEIKSIHQEQLENVQAQLSDTNKSLQQMRAENETLDQQIRHLMEEHPRRIEEMEHEHEQALLCVVSQAMEPVNKELEALRRDKDEFLALKKKYQELEALIEPFRDQLEMFEAEKSALLDQALFAENTMASLASKYTQLLGHQNSKQKIHHLDKLKQDIFNLRKELTEKNLALEKEKKARMKADTKLKELTGHKKFDPSEAFKVPENPTTPCAVAVKNPKSSNSTKSGLEAPQRKPLRSQPKGAFFVSMAEAEAMQADLEEQQQRILKNRRQNSTNFESFEVDFGSSSRRETFDVPQKLNVTHNITHNESDKENSGQGFPLDISGISVSEENWQKMKLKSNVSMGRDNRTSTPLQRHVDK